MLSLLNTGGPARIAHLSVLINGDSRMLCTPSVPTWLLVASPRERTNCRFCLKEWKRVHEEEKR